MSKKMGKAVRAVQSYQELPPGVRRSAVRAVRRRGVRGARKLGKGIRKGWRLWKRLPGFDSKTSVDGFDHRGEGFNRDEEAGDWVGPANTWLFYPITALISKPIDRALFGKPKPAFKRPKGPTEREIPY